MPISHDFRLVRQFVLGGALAMLVVPLAYGQATKAAPKRAVSEEKQLVTRDGVTLNCTYFPSAAGKNAPVAVLLHGKNGNRLVWQTPIGNVPGFAQALQANDFAVVTVDLRLHGENITGGQSPPAANKKAEPPKLTPAHHKAMVSFDLEAVKKFLLEEHEKQQLNVNKLALVAAEFSTAVALNYFVLDWSKEPYDDAPIPAQRTPRGQDVKALVLLSPDATVTGLPTTDAVQRLRALKMPVMIGVGSKDTAGLSAARKLGELISPKKDEQPQYLFLEEYDTKLRGTDMLNKGLKVEAQMYTFLDEYLKKQPGEWRTRKSPLSD
jgi:pimeloyl-ACP methyl ester carboxylesterase